MDLTKLKFDMDYLRSNEKLYTPTGIILEPYAKAHKLSIESLEKLVRNNSFFKLGTTTIKTGLFSKRDKDVDTIEWADLETVRKEYVKNPNKILSESSASSFLTQKVIQIISKERSKVDFKPTLKTTKLAFNYPKYNRTQLYKKYLPDELKKYQHEGRTESTLEKKFLKKVTKGSEFHFSDGKVAYNLLTWFQCIQMAANDIIALHLKNNDFYHWLEDKVKAPELSRICLILGNQLQNEELSEKEVKAEFLSKITKTSLNNIIFDMVILPLLRKVKSNDQLKAEEAIDKLLMLGDVRVIEPLLERIFDSQPQIRHKIIVGLGKVGDKRITPTLVKILKHSKDTQDRLLAVKTLGGIRDPRAIKALKEAAKGNDEVGLKAAQILSAAD